MAEKEEGLESMRRLIYDFLKAEDAINKSTQFGEIREWVDSVVNKLEPSIRDYSKRQIDLTMALILYEQTKRNADYKDLFCRFTEIYKNGGGVF